ncbi:MAG: replicative DNA helicase [Actinomycetota bacterium]
MSDTAAPRGDRGRVPPHNLEAEESLLGAMLLSPSAVATSLERLTSADFYRPTNAYVFDAMQALYLAGSPIDPVTVADELGRLGTLDQVGGVEALMRLQELTPATSNASRYAGIVEEHALLRRLIAVSGEIAEMSYDVPADVTKALDEAESMVFSVAERRVRDSIAPLQDLLLSNLDRLEQLYDRGDAITGVPSGFRDLDELLSGLQPNALIVVGARPAMGKTAFALGMASHAAMHAGKSVLYCSLEMGHLELTQRLLAAEARVDSHRLRNGRLGPDDWPKITKAVGKLGDAQLWIDDDPALTVMSIRAKARRLKSKVGNLGLVIVDYLQLMSGSGGRSSESRQVEVSEISRGLKILARELECPVVALSQLSRNLEQRSGEHKRPMLADLRESGSIEQDADVVMFLYRDEVYNPESPDAGMAEVIVSKHRNGPTDTVKLAWLQNYTLFKDMAKGVDGA